MNSETEKSSTAYLSSQNGYTTFTFGGTTITFLTSKNLERYTKVKKWNNGYIEVLAKNKGKEEHEDYIDLVPILENLYMNPHQFLSGIKNVEVNYA